MSFPAKNFPHKHLLSVSDYQRMSSAGILPEGSRVELIEGEIIDMAPIGSQHASFVMQFNHLFMTAVADKLQVSVQNPIVLNTYSAPEPDLALLRPRPDFYRDQHPLPEDVVLVVEVAESSMAYDRDVKISLYAAAGVAEVWLFDVSESRLTRYTGLTTGKYSQIDRLDQNSDSDLELNAMPEIRVNLSMLFATINNETG